MADSSLNNALRRLEAKRVIAADVPLSAKSGDKDKRYRVAASSGTRRSPGPADILTAWQQGW